jgi:hypothetical protein
MSTLLKRKKLLAKSSGGAPFGGLVSTANLVSVWTFDSNFNDQVGTNHLTPVNNPVRVVGKLGNGTQFVASSLQYLSHPDPLPLGDENFTFALWFKRGNTTGTEVLLSKDDETNGRSYFFSIEGAVVNWAISLTSLAYSVGISDANWHFVIVGYNAAADQSFMQLDNGSFETVACPPPIAAPAVNFRIGSREYSGFEWYFAGIIDEVILYRRVLTPAERTALWNSGNGLRY